MCYTYIWYDNTISLIHISPIVQIMTLSLIHVFLEGYFTPFYDSQLVLAYYFYPRPWHSPRCCFSVSHTLPFFFFLYFFSVFKQVFPMIKFPSQPHKTSFLQVFQVISYLIEFLDHHFLSNQLSHQPSSDLRKQHSQWLDWTPRSTALPRRLPRPGIMSHTKQEQYLRPNLQMLPLAPKTQKHLSQTPKTYRISTPHWRRAYLIISALSPSQPPQWLNRLHPPRQERGII